MTRLRAALSISSLALLLAGASLAAQEPVKIEFHRPLRNGMEFDCEIQTEHSQEYSISIAGVDKPAVQRWKVKADISGRMKILEVNKSGNPLVSEFTVRNMSGEIDGRAVDFASMKGTTISADLGRSPCEFKIKGKGTRVMPDAEALLRTAFRTASEDSLKDIVGTGKPLSPGQSWETPSKALIESMAKRKICALPGNITGTATLVGRESFRGKIDCWRIEGIIQSKGMPGFDFRLKISILLPQDEKLGGAVQILRDGIEVVDRSLPEGDPMTAGKRITAMIRDTMKAELMPVSAGTNVQSDATGLLAPPL